MTTKSRFLSTLVPSALSAIVAVSAFAVINSFLRGHFVIVIPK